MPSIKLAEAELQKRAAQVAPQFFDGKFQLQEDFIKHPSKFKAILATRRLGKSYTGALYMVKEAYENASVSIIYMALTRESAKKIMWKDILKPINRKYKLGMKFNETALTATLPNGSVIYLMGVDSSEDEKEKLLGQKYKLAIIDEAASYSIDLRELVYGVLKPAMADLGGTICMLGTPGNLTRSLFFDVTKGIEPGWHVVEANTFANPYMAKLWQEEIDELVKNQPYIVDTPMFQQMYLGRWVIDTDSLVYKFSQERNVFSALPSYLNGDWQYMLGVDLGYEDPSGFVVVAFHEHDKNLYIPYVFKKKHMDITDVAEKMRELMKRFNIHKIVVDNANKQAVEEIQKRHHITLIPAEKQGKADFIEIMNAELIQGKIKLGPDASALKEEWLNLVWKEKGLKREENPACDNHLSDGALYAWRFCYQYLSEKPKPKPKHGTKEWAAAEVEAMEEAAMEYFTKQEEPMTGNDIVYALFVGDKPSKTNVDHRAFIGAKCEKLLTEWVLKLGVNMPLFVNRSSSDFADYLDHAKTFCIPIIALGNEASKALETRHILHHKLPHPSGLNRQINDKRAIAEKLKACKRYITKYHVTY